MLKITTEENKLFDTQGQFIVTEESCLFVDVILAVLSAGIKIDNLHILHLEIFRCGIYVSFPELKQTMRYLENEGAVYIPSYLNISEN